MRHLAPPAGYIWGGTLRESGRESLAPAAGYIWGGTLRDSGWDSLAPAAGYMWGNALSFASVVLMCRLYLSRRGRRRKEGGADLSLKSNNPTLKGGEQRVLRMGCARIKQHSHLKDD